MDKTYTSLVATRDAAARTLAGVIDVDSDGASMAAHVEWRTAVEAATTPMGVLQLAGTLPPGVAAHPQGQVLAFALLTAQQGVVGYVPSAKVAKEATLMVKANKSGGLYLAKAGHFSVNLQGGVASLMLLDKAMGAIKDALGKALDLDAVDVVTEPVPSANGMSNKYRRVAKCGEYTLGDECHVDAVIEWLC